MMGDTATSMLMASIDFSTLLLCSLLLAVFSYVFLFHSRAVRDRPWALVFPAVLAAACVAWSRVVSREVPEPYLDEVFHIPQAQKYCEGKFREWDDKITTPPGLYLFSISLLQMTSWLGLDGASRCDAVSLRVGNAAGLFALVYLALLCRREIEAQLYGAFSRSLSRPYSAYALHTAFNIALFPLLFFFSGLYYTDVLSTAVVVGAFLNHLKRVAQDRSSFTSDLCTVAIGLLALLMRQTNVFWIVVFMGGLEAVHAVKTLRPERADQPFMTTLGDQIKYFAWRYSVGDIHDLPLRHAWHDDMLYTAISLVIAALCNPLRIMRQVWPYVMVLVVFAVFVAWNGGVVLGDKSNHVATLHLAQMLYIWPFFAFFSLPLLLPSVVSLLCALHIGVKSQRPQPQSTVHVPSGPRDRPFNISASSISKTSPRDDGTRPSPIAAKQSKVSLALGIAEGFKLLSWPLYLFGTVVLAGLIVRFNTIIHPFTLADNRHYMFYVFRYTIRRAGWIRYALVFAYTVSRWMVWGTLAGYSGLSPAPATVPDDSPYLSHPFWIAYSEKRQTKARYPATSLADGRTAEDSQSQRQLADDPLRYSANTASTSTGLLFLLATSLSLVTAPLVEPRYFIIPWVVWRLFVPAWRLPDHLLVSGVYTLTGRAARIFTRYDVRLVLETVWFAAVNLATCYIFIAKPYVWRAEDGTALDDGRLQRFMW
ncbi:glucosyltransferase [Purpureocillium takamizusanense]|uniref:Dol-P-Glc:Glc(2)Man(9)GlcNAc(2)-PP-Dol alpha-1,2-glucosyltransferase n=1 Tax=Purpureocillium takamizusanense TaxID=2060973 RepID=A0A9Q8Q643_9HYPO|nr:glucosyltransferase [Purpureocillium takamizusanense]UNI13274.1 glucosyltransferase [Purpureocillium takamizusanense]